MIPRLILTQARFALSQFRALCLTGPRQSGKTTLSRLLFEGKPYVNFEDPIVQNEAEQSPRSLLESYKGGAVFDEVQRVPHIFRHLQVILDNNRRRGQFILTGSNNFLLQEQVSQSLAGRAGYLSLLPLSYAEILNARLESHNLHKLILTGGYPEIWSEGLDPGAWMNSYVQTYVQRDVRLLRNISNLAAFTRLIYLSANYAGHLLNRDELAKQVGVDTKTILAWLGLLETSYIIFLLQPWHNNLNKRIVKSPKIYFYDTGLLCHLLGIKNAHSLQNHRAYGSIFENWILTEIVKNSLNRGGNENMYYFRDNSGNEVDLIIEREGHPTAIEIKGTRKPGGQDLRGLQFWSKYHSTGQALLVHAGSGHSTVNDRLSLIPWTDVADL
jgi:hypothetical protein